MKTNIRKFSLACPIAITFVLLALVVFTPAYAQDTGGVLVAAESSPVQKISVLEIRRIYLGLPPSSDSLIKNPVINMSDQKTYNAFLKNIMHMTEKGYQRKLIKRIFRQGDGKIMEIQSIDDLLDYLEKNYHDVSFMDTETAKRTKGIRVVQVLW